MYLKTMNIAARRKLVVGCALYVAATQYFLSQFVVSLRWSPPYSWANNTISDLGNTRCGPYGSRLVCSPLHALMNASFLALGISMILGSVLLSSYFRKNRVNLLGFAGIISGGIGILLVGFFPENTVRLLHETGATLPFLLGNIGVLLFGYSVDLPKLLRLYSVILGTGALVALGLYVSHVYLGIGQGGMERVVAYPQTVWLITIGVVWLLQMSRGRATITVS
jgi:hypothetical membrane protein